MLNEKEIKDMIQNISETVVKTVVGKVEPVNLSAEDKAKAEIEKLKSYPGRRERLARWTDIWANDGFDSATGKKYSIKQLFEKSQSLATDTKEYDIDGKKVVDHVTSSWYRNLIPQVISNVIREPLPMGAPLTALLTSVRFSGGNSVAFPAVNPAGNIDLDMAERQEYPELDLDMSGSVITTIGKSGIAVAFSDEAIRYSSFDLVAMHARQAVEALKRHKERKAADQIFSLGETFIDNADAGARKSGGRDINGNINYTLILDDIIDAYLDAKQEGWDLNVLIVNPLAWSIFARDPILREQFFRGIGGQFIRYPNGSNNAPQLGVNSPYGKNVGASTAFGRAVGADLGGSQASTMSLSIPGYGGLSLDMIVTPYAPVRWDTSVSKYVTDIAFVDRAHAGLLVIDEDLATEDWRDPSIDAFKMKFRERYSIVNVNNGLASRTFKNIVVDRAYFMEDKIVYDISNGALPAKEDAPALGASSSS